MKKQILIFALVVLMVGVVSAVNPAGTLTNISGIYVNDFAAGSDATANFSFDYLDYYGDAEYPHILQINLTSNDSINYPVWKGDFELSGFVRKSTWFGLSHTDIELKCSEENPLTIEHPLGSNTLDVLNGTFYCYNETSGLIDKLDKHDKVYLTIKSNPALWPGQYNLMAMVFYLEDTLGPLVSILNKDYFETHFFTIGNALTVNAIIEDNVGIEDNNYGAIIYNGSNELFRFNGQKQDETYYFPWTVPSNLPEGDFNMTVFAIDEFGNSGEDSITIKIDLTPPTIELMQPTGEIYENIIPIELAVTDEKSGVNKNSIAIRLREIINGQICPETGGSIGNYYCITTEWINLNYNESTMTFRKGVNTTELNLTSGEYWLDAKAKDILGNEAMWIQDD